MKKSAMEWSLSALVALAITACGGKLNFRHSDAADEQSSATELTPSHNDENNNNKDQDAKDNTKSAGGGAPFVVGDTPTDDPVPSPEPAPVEIPKNNDPHPDPSAVSIGAVQFAGPSCPAGSTGGLVEFVNDLASLKVTWPNEVVAEAGPGVPIARARKQCSLSLIVNVPANWVYRVKTFSAVVDSRLEQGAVGKTTAYAYFQGSAVTTELPIDRVGALDLTDMVTGDLISEWSPLNVERAFNLKISSLVDVSGAPGSHGLNIVRAESIYALQWEDRTPVP